MIYRFKGVAALAGIWLLSACGCAAVEAPILGGGGRATFNVAGFGAGADDDVDDTIAFRHAIEAVRQLGSGTVFVPAGRYLLGPIDLVNNLTLRLDPGTRLVFRDEPDLYPLVATRWAGVMQPARRPLVWADKCSNITITGGTIDGSGARWWPPQRAPATARATNGASTAAVDPGEADPALRRPPLVQLRDCQNVRIEAVSLVNPPMAALHILFSTGVQIRDVRVAAPPEATSADGMVVDSSRNVLIERCRAELGDADAIALRSGRDEDGRRMNRPTEGVTVRNCTIGTAAGGLVIGTEMSGGVRNVRFSDCRFEGTAIGVLIKTQRGRGGSVEGVTISNLSMVGVAVPFQITSRHVEGEPEVFSERTPRISGIRFSGMVAKGAIRAGILEGLEESPVRAIEFRDINLAARYGITCDWASGIRFRNAMIATDFGPAMIRSNTSDLRLDDWQETTPEAATRPAS